MKSALILLAPGCEEMEAVITMDTLRRAGIRVVSAGIDPGEVVASRGVRLLPDAVLHELEEAKSFDVLILPGGMPGTERLCEEVAVRDLVCWYAGQPDRWLAAICAAPLVLQQAQVLAEKRFTAYPGLKHRLVQGHYVDETVVMDGRLVTSQGPATSFVFALTLVELLAGKEARHAVAEGLLWPDP